jgi:plasmid replication initiation protein
VSLRKDPQGGQFDLFAPYLSEMSLRDQRETMERPFFSLAKRKRVAPIQYESPDGSIWVDVRAVPEYGMATIWDADILIWVASVLTAMKDRRANEIPRQLSFHPSELLKAINRGVGGENYERLRAGLSRLQATTIRTNLRAKGNRKVRQFSWIESWSEVTDEKTGTTRGMNITISEWLYEGIMMDGGVLAIHQDYFRLTGGRQRWLYRVARKHAGGNGQNGFTISLPTLFEKSGAEGNYRRFKFELKKIAEENALPEFYLEWYDTTQGKEPSLNMTRRSSLPVGAPGYELAMPRDKRIPTSI